MEHFVTVDKWTVLAFEIQSLSFLFGSIVRFFLILLCGFYGLADAIVDKSVFVWLDLDVGEKIVVQLECHWLLADCLTARAFASASVGILLCH